MRTLTLAIVALVTAAPLGAMQAPPAQPAAQAQAPAAKPAAPASAVPAQAKPATPAVQPAKPGAPGQPAAAPVEAVTPPPPPPPTSAQAGESYTYEPASRRDPFLNLLERGNDPTKTGYRPPGIGGMSVNEISVRGVIEKLDGGYVAMIQGPDNKTYSIHPGDKLLDGLVRAVNAEGLVIIQEVNDPLSLVKQREVSKKLRSLEAKE
jgi:Tfp pilus assembly protein PilP